MGAAKEGHSRCVNLLIPYSHVNPAPGKHTAIRAAAMGGHVDIARSLLRAKADLNIESAGGTTALMGAARGGHASMVQFLLDANANAGIVNDFNETALDV